MGQNAQTQPTDTICKPTMNYYSVQVILSKLDHVTGWQTVSANQNVLLYIAQAMIAEAIKMVGISLGVR